jgi:DNA segregation ATPase FtsK/SpoIIIE, S-DNA-T family
MARAITFSSANSSRNESRLGAIGKGIGIGMGIGKGKNSGNGTPVRRSSKASSAISDVSSRVINLVAEARWLVLMLVGMFLLLSLLTYSRTDAAWSYTSRSLEIHNAGGKIGAWASDILFYLFGLSAYIWTMVCAFSVARGYRRLKAKRLGLDADAPATNKSKATLKNRNADAPADESVGWTKVIGLLMLLIGAVGLEYSRLSWITADLPLAPGGMLGQIVGNTVHDALGSIGGTLSLLFLLAVGVSLATGLSWLSFFESLGFASEKIIAKIKLLYGARQDRQIGAVASEQRKEDVQVIRQIIDEDDEPLRIEPQVIQVVESQRAVSERQTTLFSDLPADTQLPPLNLLDAPAAMIETVSDETLEYTSRLIEKKLADFGVNAKVIAAYPGPVITRYEIEPATGVKGSQIVNLSKDLARALSLVSIRVVETIPGKNLMGLELPNARRQMVRLSEILGSQVYAENPSSLTLALGKDIAGHAAVADLAKMPHLLVAGTTGSGKSVGINAMLLSLLYKADPSQVRMILIDPKMLEMSVYDGIPHLLAPVVTDMRQAGNALNWCVGEMERRYKLMSKLGVRNLAGYNNKIIDAEKRETLIPNPFSLTPDAPEPLSRLPQIVVVIDELADLMMVVGKKIEELIARLAQKARAAGIHLILATQRPSVDVITGLIKANIPTRLSFQVSSKIDSRTILDQMGAESLLGHGDMLFMPPGSGIPQRIHGAFVADDEVHAVVQHWKTLAEPQYIEGLLEGGLPDASEPGSAVGFGGLSQTLSEAGIDAESDPLYDQAVAIVLKNKRASISLVQRHLKIGYNRAARLLEQMENARLVSSMDGKGSREILVSTQSVTTAEDE